MESNPYQSPAVTTRPNGNVDLKRRSRWGTILRIVVAAPLLLYAAACVIAAGFNAYVLASGQATPPAVLWYAIILHNLLSGVTIAAWGVGILRRNHWLAWAGFLGFVLCGAALWFVLYPIIVAEMGM